MAAVVPRRDVEPQTGGPAAAAAPLGLRPMVWLCLLAGYFALHVCIRTALSPSADLDESDQVLLAQKAMWGYGSQPPLYTWLQIGFFKLFGLSIFSLALLKNLLLGGTYVLMYLNAKLVTRSARCGVAAAVSLLFIPLMAWESQRDLTHSVLSSALAALTLLCFLRMHQTRRIGWYLGLGVVTGLGCISKYNYVFYPLGLMLAAATIAEFRSSAWNRRMLLAAAACILIFLPNGLWIWEHRDLAFGAAHKLDIQNTGTWFAAVVLGLRRLLVAMLAFLGPPLLVYVAVFARPGAGKGAEPTSGGVEPAEGPSPAACELLLKRSLLAVFALLLVMVLGFRATGIRERWLQPILITAPVLAVAVVRQRMSPARLKWLVGLGAVVMLTVVLVIPGRILLAEKLKREETLTHPYRELAAQMAKVVPEGALVVADPHLLAGNLRLGLPDRLLATPQLTELFAGHPQSCFLAWDTRRGDLPPPALVQWFETHHAKGNAQLGPPQYLTATYYYHRQRQLRLGLARAW